MNLPYPGYSMERHLDWLRALVDARFQHYFKSETPGEFQPPLPAKLDPGAPLDQTFARYGMTWVERAVLLLALAPIVRPQLLDLFLIDNTNLKRGFTEFGGARGRSHGGFLPTGETALFLAAGDSLAGRLEAMRLLQPGHYLYRDRLLQRHEPAAGEPVASALLTPTTEAMNRWLWNEPFRPDFQPGFPASRVTTSLTWKDLVLSPSVMSQILEIKSWIEHKRLIQDEWGLKRFLKAGYRCLFHGPPGTGKSLTAALLGGSLGLDVYRIDLSMVVSKFIGETEKNLAAVFDQAEHRNWILFFDEADALFGRRSATQSAHDRYANQEVSYLLQRVEDFPGIVILASNFKGNIDEAFVRRFQSMVHFPMPGPVMRLELWRQAFSLGLGVAPGVDLEDIAERFEVSGGEIVNILRSTAIRAAQHGRHRVELADLLEAIRMEFQKAGRIPDRKPE
jgi:hypothetical protein